MPKKPKSKKRKPLSVETLKQLKKSLSVKGKSTLDDWDFLLVGIGGGIYSHEWDRTITLRQLFDILTHEVSALEFSQVLDAMK